MSTVHVWILTKASQFPFYLPIFCLFILFTSVTSEHSHSAAVAAAAAAAALYGGSGGGNHHHQQTHLGGGMGALSVSAALPMDPAATGGGGENDQKPNLVNTGSSTPYISLSTSSYINSSSLLSAQVCVPAWTRTYILYVVYPHIDLIVN